MQIIYSIVLPPGCCFICRGAIRDSYVDTGVSIDYEGAFYICNLCLAEMAKMHAYLSFDEYKELRVANEELQAQNYALIKRVGELEDIERALANAGYKRNANGDVVVVGGYAPKANVETGDSVFSTESLLGIGEGETPEPVHDEGMAELHSDESGIDSSEFELDL